MFLFILGFSIGLVAGLWRMYDVADKEVTRLKKQIRRLRHD